MISESIWFFCTGTLLITLALMVSCTVFFICITYAGRWARITIAKDSPLQRLIR
jgi:hypothetical protein